MTKTPNPVSIEIIANNAVTSDLDLVIREGLVECYPKDAGHFSQQRAWHSAPEWVVCSFTPDGGVAGHIAVVERSVSVGTDDRKLNVFGLQGVFVRPPWRKTGLTGRMMSVVLDEARNRKLDAGLLFCLEIVAEKVYSTMGWEKIEATIMMRDSTGKIIPRPTHDIAMVIPLAVERFPQGNIFLNGPDW